MKSLFSLSNFRKKKEDAYDDDDVEGDDDFVELPASSGDKHTSKVIVRPFNLEDFADIKPILDALREGNTICLVNIKPLKEKDIVELKRSINKLKKTCDAQEGDIAGFGDDYIVVAPSFAKIYRAPSGSGPAPKGKAAAVVAAELEDDES